jgi:hypothetical protein
MVSTGSLAARGQILLVGSIIIGLVIVGAAVVVNSAVSIQAGGQQATNDEISDAREFDFEARKATRSITLRLNHRSWDNFTTTTPRLHDNVTENLEERWASLIARSYAKSSSVVASVDYRDGSPDIEIGRRVLQASDSQFRSEQADEADWTPVAASDGRKVGWFTMNLNLTASRANYTTADGNQNEPFNVTFVDQTTGVDRTLSIEIRTVEQPDGDIALAVKSIQTVSGTTTVKEGTCEGSSGRVLLDLRRGGSYDGDCAFIGLNEFRASASDNVTTVEFVNGDNIVGSYEMVLDESTTYGTGSLTPNYKTCRSSLNDQTEPCQLPSIWQAVIEVGFQGRSVAYENQYEVPIYQEGT